MEDNAMTTKTAKKGLAFIFALSSVLVLGGCDSIEALPENYNDAVIVNGDEAKVDVYENLMGTIYDGSVSGKTDDVLSNFMSIIAEDQFGKYSEIKSLVIEDDDAKIKAFIAAHKGAYVRDGKVGDKTEDEYLAEKFGKSVDEVQKERLQAFFESLTKKINEVFYNEIISKSYNNDTGKFFEQRLAYAHYAELYNVDITKTDWFEGYLTPELKKEDVSAFIHLDDGRYDDYIARRIIRTVYKDKIVEQYLLDNNYSTIGRAYGRKVNMIKLTRDEKYKNLPDLLLNAYATTYIDGNQPIDLETVANAWRGFHGLNADGTVIECDAAEKALLTSCGLIETTVTIDSVVYHYFEGTQYGQLIEKYNKIDEGNRYASDEAVAALSEFTNSFAYTKEKGLKIKLADMALVDYTTDGWYVKNGGLTDLPDAIRNRLFNINVSNELDHVDEATYVYKSTDYTRYVNGHYYLTPATSETGDNHNYIIYNDGSFYLIEVEEAVSTSKLNIDGQQSYVTKRSEEGVLFTESIARELADTLGTKDAYVNNAYASYIKKYSVMYHDSSIYDYFKEKYPDLFED